MPCILRFVLPNDVIKDEKGETQRDCHKQPDGDTQSADDAVDDVTQCKQLFFV